MDAVKVSLRSGALLGALTAALACRPDFPESNGKMGLNNRKDASADSGAGGGQGGATGGSAGFMETAGSGGAAGSGGSTQVPAGAAGVGASGGDAETDAGSGSNGMDSGAGGVAGCAPGTIDCGTRGCVPNDLHDCGHCGHDCTRLPNVTGSVACTADGTCKYDASACAPGYGVCSTNPDDGCAPINESTQCGACGMACSVGTPVCAAATSPATGFACVSGCPSGQSACSGSCVDTKTDPKNCGSCGHACPTDPAGRSTCTNGTTCGLVCNSGTHLCQGSCVSNTDPNNCGSKCGTNCPAPTSGGGSAACNADACSLSCPAGETACSGSCVNVSASDANNCGGCGKKCGSGMVCQSGSCTCPKGSTNCSGVCVNTSADANNCGSCGHGCFKGTCDGAGNCKPWVVATTPTTGQPNDVMTDGTHVVWLDTGLTAIKQANYDGNGVITLSEDANAFADVYGPLQHVVDLGGGIIIVASKGASALYEAQVGFASTASTPLTFKGMSTDSSELGDVSVNPTGTHFGVQVSPVNGGVPLSTNFYDCTIATLSCTELPLALDPRTEFAVTVNATSFFLGYAGTGTISSLPVGGPYTAPQTIATGTNPYGLMANDSSSVYWFSASALERVALTGGAVADVVTSFPTSLIWADLATDGRNVYYSAYGKAADPSAVAYAPVGGFADKSSKVIANLVGGASGVAAGGGKVFWIDGATIYGMAAP